MNNPLVHAFFVGRALAEAIGEQLENAVTGAMGELGKFDAEQRERLRQFTTEVLERAQQQEELSRQSENSLTTLSTNLGSDNSPNSTKSEDLQVVIDDLRAETAQLRAELQRYRSSSSS
jgi:polyhydroxyalkanoate synthesis regulator phasin